MQVALLRKDEEDSLAALERLDVLDSAPEAEFDALVRAASLVCGTPIALVSLIDRDRQWFKASVGVDGVSETPRDHAFCAHAVLEDELFEVPDAALDERFADNPLVVDGPKIRFYAGMPLTVSGGYRIGTLCVVDQTPVALNDTQREILRNLAEAASRALETRRAALALVVERRRLARSEEFLARTGRMAGVGGWEVDIPTGRITWSEELYRLHGVRPDFVPTLEGGIAFYAPEARPTIRAAVEHAMATGEGWDLELPFVQADGTSTWVRTVGAAELVDGIPVRLAGAFQDITERKRLSMQLSVTLDELGDLYDNAPYGYYSIDAEGRFLRVNATALAWFGRTREEIVGKKRELEFDDDSARLAFARGFAKLKADGRVDGIEFDLKSDRAPHRRVSVTATAVRDSTGRFIMTRSVLFDVTELHRAREELLRLNREQAAMLNNEMIGIIKVRDRRAVWVNRGMDRIFGYDGEEWLDMPVRRIYADDATYEKTGREAYTVMNEGGLYRGQFRGKRRDGTEVWIDASGVALADEPGSALLLLADITLLKQAEETRMKAFALKAQNAQLIEAGRLKDEFLTNMSHELRTPLNGIIGLAQLMQSGAIKPDSPKYASSVSRIGSSGRHLLQLIESMLDFAQLQSRKLVFRPQAVYPADAIRDVTDMLQPKSEEQQVSVRTQVDRDLGVVHVDPIRLRQVLMNLVDNAIKFSRQGGQIEVRAKTSGALDFCIEVQDHGIGIAESDMPRLFTRFGQLSTGNAKTHGGTGMGLALARKVAEAQGGSVDVESTLGQGSTFRLRLPKLKLNA